ncbi:MAG: tetratricopeptide repeat protein [Leadbetterella sp.]|nr:tetratricopeptide repeat protein [Leadbetterella sp.]
MQNLLRSVVCFLSFFPVQDPDREKNLEKYQARLDHYLEQESDSTLIVAEELLGYSAGFPLGKVIAAEYKGLYYELVESQYDKAGNEYLEALRICESENLPYIAEIYHNLGLMYHTTDNYEKGRGYYELAHKFALKHNNRSLEKKILVNWGSVNSSLKNFDRAEELFARSLAIPVNPRDNYDIYANLGNLSMRKKDYRKALEYFEKATEAHPDNEGAEKNLRFLLDAKGALKDSSGMHTLLPRAIKSFEADRYLREKSLMAMAISEYYRKFGFYEKALEYKDKYLQIYEEIKEKQRDDIVYEAQARFDLERKEDQLRLLQFEKEKKEQQNLVYLVLAAAGLVIAASTGFFLYKNRRKNNQLNRQKQILETTLDEKNILLREVHHRVKNSFQIVSSLLYLQSENLDNSDARQAIREAENRVRSMVLIHQKLYNTEEVVGINTTEYFEDLVRDILESHTADISCRLDIRSLVLDIDTITPLGLILNELITNALKHAFPPNNAARLLHVSFQKEKDRLVLKVQDNGRGFAEEIKDTSFGIKLMKALAGKIKAQLHYAAAPGGGTEAVLIVQKFNILS